MHHKKFGAWQSPAFRDIYTFVRRFQIRFFTTFAPFLACLRRTDKNRKLSLLAMECYADVDTATTLKKWIISIFSCFRAELQKGLFLVTFPRFFPYLSH
jgi:hypothetical protein